MTSNDDLHYALGIELISHSVNIFEMLWHANFDAYIRYKYEYQPATLSIAQVTLCRSGGPDLYDLKNREHRHGRLMKSWQHRTDILEVCSVGKRSAVIGKPVRQSFTVKLCRVGRDWLYNLFMDRFQSCVESETSWDYRTQREGIRGQRVGIRGQRMDGREDRINITIASCLIVVILWLLRFHIFQYMHICLCIYVYLLMIWLYSWVEGDSTLLIVLMRKSRGYNCGKWEWELNWYLRGINKKWYWIWTIHRLILVRYNDFVYIPIYMDE